MNRDIVREKLKALTHGRVLFDEPMSNHASMGVGGRADCLAFPVTASEVSVMVAYLQAVGVPYLPVGRCSNLIVRDGGFRGVLISLSELRALEIQEAPEGRMRMTAEAGVPLAEIVRISVDESLTGMEFCAGIPGLVGGAVRMNAGAYGSDMSRVTEKITLINGSGTVRDVLREALSFTYRHLELPERGVIVRGSFLLCRGDREAIRTAVTQNMETRKQRHPLHYPSAGSIFKNPPEVPAGRIVEELGLKGRRIGGAAISDVHGNFIVNLSGATASDVLALMALVQEKCLTEKGIVLEPEVEVVGVDDEKIL